jgi:hypothetical protein
MFNNLFDVEEEVVPTEEFDETLLDQLENQVQ